MHRKTIFKYLGLALSGWVTAAPVVGQEMPKTMEEMWEIIQAQQKEIETLKAKQVASEKAATGAAGEPAGDGETDRKLGILGEEIEKLKTKLVIPETPELKSKYGLGPAASKVYGVEKGLSIGGYGEIIYQNFVNDEGTKKDTADAQRLVLYTGYKFTDNILFNSELEFEHGTTGKDDGEVSIEFANLDFFLHPMANIRAGLVLVPMGFINEIHEPPFFHGVNRPEVERKIIPSTWREVGGGLFGELAPGLQYRMYAINGLLASKNGNGFSSDGIRGGRQSGSKSVAEDWAFTGRLDYSPELVPGLLVGASAFLGNSAQDTEIAGKDVDAFTQLYEGHIQYRHRGLELRALGAWGQIDDAAELSAARTAAGKKDAVIGTENFGWYVEAAYDVMPLLFPESLQYLAPFVRFEQFDTLAKVPSGFEDNGAFDREIWQAGLTYKPIPQVVIKADYRNFESKGTDPADEFNLGLGFVF